MSGQQMREPNPAFRHQGRRAYVIFSWALLLFLLAQVAFPLFLSTMLRQLAPWTTLNLNLSLLLTYGSMYAVGFPMLWLMLGTIPDRGPSRPAEAEQRPGPGRILALYAMLTALSTAALLLAGLLLTLLGQKAHAPLEGLRESGANPWLLFVLAVIVAPVMEELVFRWLPYRKLAAYGMRNYVLWTSLAFGLFHLNLLQGLYAALMGLVFAIVTYRTGRARYSIVLHFLVNLTSSLGLGGLVTAETWGTVLYGAFHLLLCLAGLVVLVVCLRRHFFRLRDDEGCESLEPWRSVFLTGGFLVFTVLCVLLMVLFH